MKKILRPIDNLIKTLDQIDTSVGYCMCGDDMERHESAYNCGHTPVDAGDYHIYSSVKEIKECIPVIKDIIKDAVEVINTEYIPVFFSDPTYNLRKSLKGIDLTELNLEINYE